MVKVLLVEDDLRIASFVQRGLEAEGYRVDLADNGRDALEFARAQPYPLIVLDRMLPDKDGLEICRSLRESGSNSLILMLTAKDGLQDKLDGLNSGADDYITKPFSFDELLARMQAMLRRGNYQEASDQLRVGDLVLSHSDRKVRRGERDIVLTAKEFALLGYLMAHPGRVLSRARLLNNVWRYGFEPGTKIVDVYIRYLRRKIDEGEAKPLIHTLRGVGYKIADEPEPKSPH